MAFKDLHKLKKVVVVEKEFIKVPHLVVGKDIFALSVYTALKEKYGKDQVRLLSEDTILKSDLLPKGPSTVRGENNQKIIHQLYPDAVREISAGVGLFYKDMTWKSFSGRSKSEALKFDEEYFTTARFNVDMTTIFPELLHADDFLIGINEETYKVRLKSINRSSTGFKVECLNGTEFECEKLYFGQSPYNYLQLYSLKNELSNSFTQFCESTKTPSALCVKFVFEKPISDLMETLFIPLSYTHEWGHFVGEFNTINGNQEIEFIHFLDEDQASEEDISRFIRLLKKNLEKIFEKFSIIKSQEYIVLEQDIGCLKIDSDLFENSFSDGRGEMENLFYLGNNAPIANARCEKESCEYSVDDATLLARGLLNHSLLIKKI